MGHRILAIPILLCVIAPTIAQPYPADDPVVKQVAADPQHPIYHFAPPKNWMNDPNGLIQFKGQYHLFYQHNPSAAVWGNMTWGHAVSPDMIHWKHLPFALHPDQKYDKGGVFSGCMVNDNGTAVAVYTGVSPECQAIATSPDLLTWTKYEGNPVIAAPPPGLKVTGFRDPCVWKEGDTWNMVVGSGIKDVGGTILLYKSPDLRKWTYIGPILTGDKSKTGDMWECPNFFPLGDKWLLVISPIPFARAIYFVGTFREDRFTPEVQGEIDQGGALYAPQFFRDSTGRLIMFGWLWENYDKAEKRGWQGVQSLPRVVTLGPDNRLRFAVAEEAKSLRGQHTMDVQSTFGDCLEIMAEFEPATAQPIGLKLRAPRDSMEQTLILFDPAKRELSIDRSRSSVDLAAKKNTVSTALSLDAAEPLRLHIFLDRSVVEVLANNKACLTTRIYPALPDSRQIGLVGGSKLRSFDAWQLKSMEQP